MKENRRIEELILMYVTSSTTILKKDKVLEGDGWKLELNKQVAIFIRILRETLRTVHHVPAELVSRLEMYSNKLTLPREEAGPSAAVRKAPKERDSWVQIAAEGVIADMPLVQTVGRLFTIDDATLQRDVNALARICTDKVCFLSFSPVLELTNELQAAIVDLKVIYGNYLPCGCLYFEPDMSEEYYRWNALSWPARGFPVRYGLSAVENDRKLAVVSAYGCDDET